MSTLNMNNFGSSIFLPNNISNAATTFGISPEEQEQVRQHHFKDAMQTTEFTNNAMLTALLKESQRSQKKDLKIKIDWHLTTAQRSILRKDFTEYDVDTSEHPANSHTHVMAEVVDIIHRKLMFFSISQQDKDTPVKLIGDRGRYAISSGLNNVHVCRPMLDGRDAARIQKDDEAIAMRLNALKKYVASGSLTEPQREEMKAIKKWTENHGERAHCQNTGQACSFQSKIVIAMHSVLDMTPHQFIEIMIRAGATKAYAFFTYLPEVLFCGKAANPDYDVSATAKIEEALVLTPSGAKLPREGTITFSFGKNGAYVHTTQNVSAWYLIPEGFRYKSNAGHWYSVHVERADERASVMKLEIRLTPGHFPITEITRMRLTNYKGRPQTLLVIPNEYDKTCRSKLRMIFVPTDWYNKIKMFVQSLQYDTGLAKIHKETVSYVKSLPKLQINEAILMGTDAITQYQIDATLPVIIADGIYTAQAASVGVNVLLDSYRKYGSDEVKIGETLWRMAFSDVEPEINAGADAKLSIATARQCIRTYCKRFMSRVRKFEYVYLAADTSDAVEDDLVFRYPETWFPRVDIPKEINQENETDEKPKPAFSVWATLSEIRNGSKPTDRDWNVSGESREKLVKLIEETFSSWTMSGSKFFSEAAVAGYMTDIPEESVPIFLPPIAGNFETWSEVGIHKYLSIVEAATLKRLQFDGLLMQFSYYAKYQSKSPVLNVRVSEIRHLKRKSDGKFDTIVPGTTNTRYSLAYPIGTETGEFVKMVDGSGNYNDEEVSKDCEEILVSEDLVFPYAKVQCAKLATLEEVTNRKVRLVRVTGPAGSAKTSTAVQIAREGDVLFAATIAAKEGIRKRLDEADKTTILAHTLDSGILNLTGCYTRIIVDEAVMVHYGCIAWLAEKLRCETVVLLGDPEQVKFISYTGDLMPKFADPPVYSFMLNQKYTARMTRDTVRLLKNNYHGAVDTTNNVGDSIEVLRVQNVAAEVARIAEKHGDDVAHIMTFTHKDERDLKDMAPSIAKKVRTVAASQGEDERISVLARLTDIDIDIFKTDRITGYLNRHQLVGVSRHKEKLYYVTNAKLDDLATKIEEAQKLPMPPAVDRAVLNHSVTSIVETINSPFPSTTTAVVGEILPYSVNQIYFTCGVITADLQRARDMAMAKPVEIKTSAKENCEDLLQKVQQVAEGLNSQHMVHIQMRELINGDVARLFLLLKEYLGVRFTVVCYFPSQDFVDIVTNKTKKMTATGVPVSKYITSVKQNEGEHFVRFVQDPSIPYGLKGNVYNTMDDGVDKIMTALQEFIEKHDTPVHFEHETLFKTRTLLTAIMTYSHTFGKSVKVEATDDVKKIFEEELPWLQLAAYYTNELGAETDFPGYLDDAAEMDVDGKVVYFVRDKPAVAIYNEFKVAAKSTKFLVGRAEEMQTLITQTLDKPDIKMRDLWDGFKEISMQLVTKKKDEQDEDQTLTQTEYEQTMVSIVRKHRARIAGVVDLIEQTYMQLPKKKPYRHGNDINRCSAKARDYLHKIDDSQIRTALVIGSGHGGDAQTLVAANMQVDGYDTVAPDPKAAGAPGKIGYTMVDYYTDVTAVEDKEYDLVVNDAMIDYTDHPPAEIHNNVLLEYCDVLDNVGHYYVQKLFLTTDEMYWSNFSKLCAGCSVKIYKLPSSSERSTEMHGIVNVQADYSAKEFEESLLQAIKDIEVRYKTCLPPDIQQTTSAMSSVRVPAAKSVTATHNRVRFTPTMRVSGDGRCWLMSALNVLTVVESSGIPLGLGLYGKSVTDAVATLRNVLLSNRRADIADTLKKNAGDPHEILQFFLGGGVPGVKLEYHRYVDARSSDKYRLIDVLYGDKDGGAHYVTTDGKNVDGSLDHVKSVSRVTLEKPGKGEKMTIMPCWKTSVIGYLTHCLKDKFHPEFFENILEVPEDDAAMVLQSYFVQHHPMEDYVVEVTEGLTSPKTAARLNKRKEAFLIRSPAKDGSSYHWLFYTEPQTGGERFDSDGGTAYNIVNSLMGATDIIRVRTRARYFWNKKKTDFEINGMHEINKRIVGAAVAFISARNSLPILDGLVVAETISAMEARNDDFFNKKIGIDVSLIHDVVTVVNDVYGSTFDQNCIAEATFDDQFVTMCNVGKAYPDPVVVPFECGRSTLYARHGYRVARVDHHIFNYYDCVVGNSSGFEEIVLPRLSLGISQNVLDNIIKNHAMADTRVYVFDQSAAQSNMLAGLTYVGPSGIEGMSAYKVAGRVTTKIKNTTLFKYGSISPLTMADKTRPGGLPRHTEFEQLCVVEETTTANSSRQEDLERQAIVRGRCEGAGTAMRCQRVYPKSTIFYDTATSDFTSAATTSILQEAYDHTLPGNSDFPTFYQQYVKETNNEKFYIPQHCVIKYNKDCVYGRLRLPAFKPALRTGLATKRRTTQRELLRGLLKRNFFSNSLRLPGNEKAFAAQVWRETASKFFIPDWQERIRRLNRDGASNSIERLRVWLKNLDGQKADKLMALGEKSMDDVDLTVFDLSLKPDIKATCSTKIQTEYPKPQVVVATEPYVTEIFTTIFKQLVDNLKAILKPHILLSIGTTEDDIASFFSSQVERNVKTWLEMDLSSYDKSQQGAAMHMVRNAWINLGFPEDLWEIWETASARSYTRTRHTGVAFTHWLQRRSGAPDTAGSNSLFLLLMIGHVYRDVNIEALVVLGDDNLAAVSSGVCDYNRFIDEFAYQFNVEAKLIRQDHGYFCGRFLVWTTDGWLVLPDPVKRIEKLGSWDIRNHDQLLSQYQSFHDLCKRYNNEAINEKLSTLVADRYKTNYDYTAAIGCLYNLSRDEKFFLTLYEDVRCANGWELKEISRVDNLHPLHKNEDGFNLMDYVCEYYTTEQKVSHRMDILRGVPRTELRRVIKKLYCILLNREDIHRLQRSNIVFVQNGAYDDFIMSLFSDGLEKAVSVRQQYLMC